MQSQLIIKSFRRLSIIMGLLLIVTLLPGCGDPQAPEISYVQISYWDVCDGEGQWQAIESGGTAKGSPLRIEGLITDNTAVVSPTLTLAGQRRDVIAAGVELAYETGEDGFYEAPLTCQADLDNFYACDPAIPVGELIRGARFVLSAETPSGDTFEWELRV